MFATIKQIFNPKNRDLQKRILFTLAALFVFKIGTAIIVPGVNASTSGMSVLEVLDAMSGGAFQRASIFALGVTPYITAQIIIQLLAADIVPYLSELSKQGGTGRRKLNQITRVTGIILAFLQGYMYSYAFIGNGNAMDYMLYSLILTAGTALLMWIADQITLKGLGNGMSLIIMAGIISVLPNMFKNLWIELFAKGFVGIVIFALFILIFVAIIVGVIFVSEAERRIPIQYSNRSAGSYGGQQTFLPLKLNSAGVMPVIIASVIMGIPSMLTYFVKNAKVLAFINKFLTTNTTIGFIIYLLLIVAFTYIYTFLTINPEELSKNLNQNGGYIPGVRPGSETKKYISTVLGRITFLGAIFIAVIAALPTLFTSLTGLSDTIKLGGTSILIAVGVVLETYKQLESSVASRNYNNRR